MIQASVSEAKKKTSELHAWVEPLEFEPREGVGLTLECSILKYRVPSLWPTYIGEMMRTFAKAYGIQVKGSMENMLGNTLGT